MFVGTVIIAVLTYTMYQRLAGQKPTVTEQITKYAGTGTDDSGGGSSGSMDPILALNKAAHLNANKEWCTQGGYQFNAVTQKCAYTEAACLAMSNNTYKSKENKPFNIWANGQCISAPSVGVFRANVCNNKIFKTTYDASLGFHPGDITCDDKGICTYTEDCTDPDNLDGGKCPTCVIPSGYCNSKGMDYDSLGGLGDCTESDVQAVFEAIFGKTLTRTYKRNWENMQKECGHKFLSLNCAKSVGTFYTTGAQIAVKTYQKYMNDLVDNFKKECGGNFTDSTQDFVNCAWAMAKFNPAIWVTEMGVKMADGMLNTLFGWTGMPNNVLQRGVGYAVKYGIKAAAAVFHFGEKAVQAIDKAGHMAMAFMEKVPIIGPLAKFTDFGIALAGLDLMIKYAGPAIKALAHIGEAAVHIGIKFAEAGLHVLNAAVGAVLHPIDFAKKIWDDLKDPKVLAKNLEDLVVNAVNMLKSAGKLFKQGWAAFKAGVKIAGQVLSKVWDKLKDVGKDIENGLEDAGGAIASGLSSLF